MAMQEITLAKLAHDVGVNIARMRWESSACPQYMKWCCHIALPGMPAHVVMLVESAVPGFLSAMLTLPVAEQEALFGQIVAKVPSVGDMLRIPQDGAQPAMIIQHGAPQMHEGSLADLLTVAVGV